jgi:hypothetical protein
MSSFDGSRCRCLPECAHTFWVEGVSLSKTKTLKDSPIKVQYVPSGNNTNTRTPTDEVDATVFGASNLTGFFARPFGFDSCQLTCLSRIK